MSENEYKTHPSYGQIVLTKPTSGGGATLFGSKVKHPSFISVSINEAKLSEDGFGEHVFGGNTILRFDMSEAQWAHMVSSFGDGSGTPVTLRLRDNGQGYIEHPPEQAPVIDLAKQSAQDTKNALVKRLKDLETDVKKVSEGSGTVTKKDMKKLAMDFNILAWWLSSNFDYLENQVVERMENEVAKANIEIEAIISNAVQRLGHKALGEKLAAGENSVIHDMLLEEGD